MITVSFWNFEKRKNSTKVPTTTATATYSGEIKGDFSPLHLTVVFKLTDETTLPTYNFAQISAFSRYYFVEWAFVDGLWCATFTVDVLASYRSQILASSQYVARSSSLRNTGIIDGAYQTNSSINTSVSTVTQASMWGSDWGAGTYVIGVVGYSGANIGAVTYYAMNYDAYHAFMSALLSSPSWLNISTSEISEELQKALINPAQYIVSCIWLPISATAFIIDVANDVPQTDYTKTIVLGWWSFQLPAGAYIARMLHNPNLEVDMFSKTCTFTLNKHPQASTRGVWLNLSPYGKLTLSCPPFGVFDLDTVDFMNASEVVCKVFVHSYTGKAKLYVFTSSTSAIPVLESEANVGIQLPVGQIAMNLDNIDQAIMTAGVVGANEIVNTLANSPSVVSAKANTRASGGTAGGTTISGNYGGSHHSGKF